MKRTARSGPDRLEFRSGGGCAMVFFVGLFLVGLAGATSPFWRQLMPSAYFNLYLAVPVGIVMALLGFLGIFGKMEVRIDRVDRSVISGWRVLGFGRDQRRGFQEFESVKIIRHERSSGNVHRHGSTFVSYQVAMIAGKAEVTVGENIGELPEARALAEELARFVGVEVLDASGEQPDAPAE
jgi:hypothetical protein